jgi:hypothetical protein
MADFKKIDTLNVFGRSVPVYMENLPYDPYDNEWVDGTISKSTLSNHGPIPHNPVTTTTAKAWYNDYIENKMPLPDGFAMAHAGIDPDAIYIYIPFNYSVPHSGSAWNDYTWGAELFGEKSKADMQKCHENFAALAIWANKKYGSKAHVDKLHCEVASTACPKKSKDWFNGTSGVKKHINDLINKLKSGSSQPNPTPVEDKPQTPRPSGKVGVLWGEYTEKLEYNMNVRTSPSLNATIKGVLPKGTVIEGLVFRENNEDICWMWVPSLKGYSDGNWIVFKDSSKTYMSMQHCYFNDKKWNLKAEIQGKFLYDCTSYVDPNKKKKHNVVPEGRECTMLEFSNSDMVYISNPTHKFVDQVTDSGTDRIKTTKTWFTN